MMRCDKHRKDFVGRCMWCGRQLCSLCVARQDGNKLYCDKCRGMLGSIRRPEIPRQALPSKGRRFVMKDGFLVVKENEY